MSSINKYQRIVIVGTTGSGKTTLARALSKRLGMMHIEMDALHWGPNWTPYPREQFLEQVAAATSQPRWVLDGNYAKMRDLIWPRADTIVWLNYPLPVNLWRLWWRIMRRIFTREVLWGTNQESLKSLYVHFFTRDSLFLYALKSHPKHRCEYPILFQQPQYAHLHVAILRSPEATECWLASLAADAVSAPCQA